MVDVVQQGSTVYQTTLPVIDPVTGVSATTWTVEHETETQRLEAGYDALGRAIQVLHETTSPDDPTVRAVNSSRRTRSVEDEISSYDAAGVLLPTDHEIVQGLRAPIAASHVQITDGVVLNAEALDTVRVLSVAATELAAAAGPRARAERVGSDRIRVVNDLSRDDAAPVAGAGQAPPPSRGSYVRTWRRHGSSYLLERTELTSEWAAPDGVRRTERQVDRIRMVRVHQNARRDAERRARRGETGQGADNVLASLGDQPGDNCVVGQDCPPEDPPPVLPGGGCPGPVPQGADIVFQHGIKSDRHTWSEMASWLGCDIVYKRFDAHDIDWRRRITSQRDELRPLINADMHDIVMIGHSNGGLVVRSLAQWAQVNQPGLVKGVITLDSPNQGAVVARNVRIVHEALGSGAAALGLGLSLMEFHPFFIDDIPGSSFLQNLNATQEAFINVGIRTHTPKRWVAWRVIKTGDCLPRHECELAVVRRIQRRYDDMRHTSKFWYRPWHSIPAGEEARLMNGFDATWNWLTAPGDLTSDGFIPGPAQHYPGARFNRVIPDGDSHTGTTTSELVHEAVKEALINQSLFDIDAQS
jgi:hypothetical protein